MFKVYDPPHKVDDFSFDDPTLPFHDPIVVLTLAAAVTRELRLATGIALLPLQQPLLYAKEIASLDLLSGGRLSLGVGSGWAREEYTSLGLPFERRGARLGEYVEAMRALWRNDEATYQGEFVSFAGAYSFPKPFRGDVPILIGGNADAVLRRIARIGDGWVAVRLSPDQVAAGMRTIRDHAREFGRDPGGIRLVTHAFWGRFTIDDVKRYRDAGVDEFVIATGGRLPTAPGELRDTIRRLAEEFIEPLE
jgi:probable F420-dependent oxidoreductase